MEDKHIETLISEVRKSRKLNSKEHKHILKNAKQSRQTSEKLDEVLDIFKGIGNAISFLQKAVWVIIPIVVIIGMDLSNVFGM